MISNESTVAFEHSTVNMIASPSSLCSEQVSSVQDENQTEKKRSVLIKHNGSTANVTKDRNVRFNLSLTEMSEEETSQAIKQPTKSLLEGLYLESNKNKALKVPAIIQKLRKS